MRGLMNKSLIFGNKVLNTLKILGFQIKYFFENFYQG